MSYSNYPNGCRLDTVDKIKGEVVEDETAERCTHLCADQGLRQQNINTSFDFVYEALAQAEQTFIVELRLIGEFLFGIRM